MNTAIGPVRFGSSGFATPGNRAGSFFASGATPGASAALTGSAALGASAFGASTLAVSGLTSSAFASGAVSAVFAALADSGPGDGGVGASLVVFSAPAGFASPVVTSAGLASTDLSLDSTSSDLAVS